MDETWKAEDKDVKSTRDVLKKWNDYYANNNFGIGIQCDKCKKWREVFQYEDQSEVPEVWICSMWKMDGHRRGSCRIPSNLNEDHFAEALFSPGALVWAKCPGYPWWPAMIEDCPDVQHYFIPYVDSEHEYHVNFFGKKPLRNWIKASNIKDFSTPPRMTPKAKKSKDLLRSIEQANEALKISPKERLKKYSFAVRYKGRWAKVKELDKVDLPPNCLKRKRKEKSTDLGPQLVAEEPPENGNCDRTSTVRKVRKGKSKSEIGTKRKSVNNEGFHPVQQSTEAKRNEFAEDPEKEENCEEEDSSEFRPQHKAEAPHVHQDIHRKSTVRKPKNVNSKSKDATNRKSVKKEEFQPVLQSVGALSESSLDSEKEDSEEGDSSEFRPQLKAEAPHVNQDSQRKSTVREPKNVKSKSEDATNRKSVKEEEFQPVLQSVGALSESSLDSEKEDSEEEDSSEFRSQLMTKGPYFNQDFPRKLTVWKLRNAKSKATTNRKPVDQKEFQPVQQSMKKSKYPAYSENGEVEDLSETRSHVMAKETHFNQDCPSTLTVWKVRNAKSKPEDAIKRKFVHNEEFQTVKQSIKHKRSECSASSEEENSEEQDSSGFRSQVIAKEPLFNQECPSTLTVWKIRNAKSKSEDATNEKSVAKEEFQPDLQSVGAISESSSDSEKEENSEEEDSSEFRSKVMTKEPHFNQDCPRTLTVWKLRNAKSKAATNRKPVDRKEFHPVQQSIRHKKSEYPAHSENGEVGDLSETRSPVTAESTACQYGHCISTVREVEGKSEDTTNRKLVDNKEFQSVQRSIKHKRNECSTDSENEESEEDSPILNDTTTFSDGEEGDASVLNHKIILSDSEEEESPEVKEYLKKKYQPLHFVPDSKLLSVNGTGGNCSHRNSDSTIHYKHEDNFSENGSIICHEDAAKFLENDTVIHNENAVENSQHDSGANVLDTDASLLRTRYPSCFIPKNEQFSDRSERLKKNRERIRKLINSNNSKYMPYSFYRGRMKK